MLSAIELRRFKKPSRKLIQNRVLFCLFVTTANQRPIKSEIFNKQDDYLKQTSRTDIIQIIFSDCPVEETS
ncbi:MAG: hypothetical protein DRP65_11290 [Planctomycetota bacterium]|nr:MAG: hypothetical protein DRP65_11290 [Planctomycetota bacterium]